MYILTALGLPLTLLTSKILSFTLYSLLIADQSHYALRRSSYDEDASIENVDLYSFASNAELQQRIDNEEEWETFDPFYFIKHLPPLTKEQLCRQPGWCSF